MCYYKIYTDWLIILLYVMSRMCQKCNCGAVCFNLFARYFVGYVYFACFRAVKAFQELLYVEPTFRCANEAHIRLGLMLKFQGDYTSSIKVSTVATSRESVRVQYQGQQSEPS